MRFEAVSSTQQTVTIELKAKREEAFLRHSILCMRDVNIVRKRAGTILSDGINKYLLSFLYGFLWPQFGNLIVTLYTLMCCCLQRLLNYVT
jgi:hypothetical protein